MNAHGERALHACCTPTGRFCCKACDWFDPCCEGRISEFAAYGSGQTAYFKFLKLLAWVFALMTLCSIPALLVNVNGRGALANLNTLTLAATTLGNMGTAALAASGNATLAQQANATAALTAAFSAIPGWSLVVPAGTPLTPTLVALIYSGSDLAACFILFVAFIWLRAGEAQEQRQVNKATITADDYTIFVPNPPPHATEELLREHFSEYLQQQAPRPANHPGFYRPPPPHSSAPHGEWVEGDFSTVEEVHVIEDDTTLVQLYVKRGKLQRKAERVGEALRSVEEALQGRGGKDVGCCWDTLASRARGLRARREAMRAEMAQLTQAAMEHVATHERYAVGAFVTFRHQAARDWVLESYGEGCLAWACQPRALRLPLAPEQRRAGRDPRAAQCCCANHLTVKPAPSPTAVIWTNLHISFAEHACRQAITGTFTLALLAVSFAALWFASSQTATLQQQGALATCASTSASAGIMGSSSSSSGGSVGMAIPLLPQSPAMLALHGAGVPPTNATKYCTCAALPWSSMALSSVSAGFASTGLLDAADCPFQSCPRWLELDVKGAWAQAFCQDWLWNRSYAAVIMVGAASLVLFINFGLGYIMRLLTGVEGHHSWEDLNSSLALRLFFATALNTGLLVVLINVAWPFVVPLDYFATGKYSDFSPSWYDNVGTALIATMIINLLSPHVYDVVCGLRYCSRVRNPELSAPTQRDLNRAVLGPLNDPAIRYAQIFNTLFVCFVFSTGLPLMIPIAALSFLLFFWVDKLTFLWYFRKPPAFSVSLQQTMTALLPFALLLHLGVGTWMLSASSIFAQVDLSSVTAYTDPLAAQLVALSGRNAYVSEGVQRVTQQGVLPIFIFFCFIAAWMALQFVAFFILHAGGGALHLLTCGQCLKGSGGGEEGGGSSGRRAPNWDLSTPTYLRSLERPPVDNKRSSTPLRSVQVMNKTMQGRESYNMLLDPEIMYAFGISYEWAKTHKGAFERAGRGFFFSPPPPAPSGT